MHAQRRARSYCGLRYPRACVILSMTPRRLHRSRDIRAVFAARNAAHGRLMTVHAARRALEETPGTLVVEGDPARVAVIAGRDVGGAVQRNRAKRRLRAALAAGSLPSGFDLVVRARPAAAHGDFKALRAELCDLIGRATAKAGQGVAGSGRGQA